MQVFNNPPRESWERILARPDTDHGEVRTRVGEILETVKREGDRALKEFSRQFDRVELETIRVSKAEIDRSGNLLRDGLKNAIGKARKNIEAFHSMQAEGEKSVHTSKGVKCWVKVLPIEKVGLYIPGGSAPLLSTVLMLGIPARMAGCEEIILCTPPGPAGTIHPAILYCAGLLDIDRVYRAGGAQAIAAMAYGTETIPRVDKIFGPGNPFVTLAKQLVSLENAAIDMPAGPSEVAVIADASADPSFVAADLMAQAEHGPESQVILLTTSRELAERAREQLDKQLTALPRRDIADAALHNSRCIVLDDMDTLLEMVNIYAPEHLIIMAENQMELAGKIRNAGSVFLGPYTPVSAGDYASGTNHTLPTGGHARAYSGLGLESFTKRISFQEINESGMLDLGPAIMEMADEEKLEAHSRSVMIRIDKIRKNRK